MATPAQIAANIANAQHSTGPRSDEGKQRAAANSTKHGLTGAFAVLPNENQKEFDDLFLSLVDEFSPQSEHETFLVEQMAQSRWRVARIDRLETSTHARSMEKGHADIDSDARVADFLLEKGAAILATFARYRTAAQNAYHKCEKQLVDARSGRAAAQTVLAIDAAIAGLAKKRDFQTNPIPAAPKLRNEPNLEPREAGAAENDLGKAA